MIQVAVVRIWISSNHYFFPNSFSSFLSLSLLMCRSLNDVVLLCILDHRAKFKTNSSRLLAYLAC